MAVVLQLREILACVTYVTEMCKGEMIAIKAAGMNDRGDVACAG